MNRKGCGEEVREPWYQQQQQQPAVLCVQCAVLCGSDRQRLWHNNFSCSWRMMVRIRPSVSSSILVILACLWGCIGAESLRANFLDNILADLSQDYQQLEYGWVDNQWHHMLLLSLIIFQRRFGLQWYWIDEPVWSGGQEWCWCG